MSSIYNPLSILDINDDFYLLRNIAPNNHTISIGSLTESFGEINYPPQSFSPPRPPPPSPPPVRPIILDVSFSKTNTRIQSLTSNTCSLTLNIPLITSPPNFEYMINGNITFDSDFVGTVTNGIVSMVVIDRLPRQSVYQNVNFSLKCLSTELTSYENTEINFLDINKSIIINDTYICPAI